MGVMTTVAVSGEPPLIIHAAVFAGADVTRKLQALVTPDRSIIMKGSDLIGHFGDPWPEAGNYRALVVLYQYGERPSTHNTDRKQLRHVLTIPNKFSGGIHGIVSRHWLSLIASQIGLDAYVYFESSK